MLKKLIFKPLLYLLLMATVGYWVFDHYSSFPVGRPEQLIANLTGHSVTIMSILVAAGAILMSIASTRLIRNLVRTNHYHRLVTSLLISIILFLSSAVIGIIALYLPTELVRVFLAGLSGLFAVGVASFADTGWKLYVVLNALHQRP
ncbi:hypothetical protein [uncultured Amphritea sp.]|uniref:hypothetical protein n=1 Tax=uncultured Amphritea sp. TaxID=981605 RepID=UPI00260DC90D|nr:hypothetical protein [uncultured Amphritea sp.]